MTPEPEQNAAATAGAAAKAAGAKAGSKPRYGVPVWRTGKPDAFLAAAVDAARTAVESIAPAEQIGRHLGAKSEGDRLVTHLFESKLPGYGGWQWYAVLTRNSRSKVVTVDELGLLPSEDSILAPEWVPWAERVRPEDAQQDDDAAPASGAATEPAADDDAAPASGAATEPAADDDAAEAPAVPEDGAGSGAAEDDSAVEAD
ncbi:DUF3027 domain-containing protein [Arthrobacter sp. UKPF54-2]|uniref:DUF3027 domain-containing protein n=1 Tax=Arthrobacter sp. UKPF54-2 TaxID=2600159 RepID=UPI0011B1135B|nr:DUF3027 domain-containing protein [Arthrobacter sp. UKPF54-2]QDY89163.1 DUF3027 domain-containing protein [Arthrobacter sp. UKPF54-2]